MWNQFDFQGSVTLRGKVKTINVENPICRLSLNSEVPANVNMNAEIIGIKGGEEISHLRVGKDFDTEPILFEGGRKRQDAQNQYLDLAQTGGHL